MRLQQAADPARAAPEVCIFGPAEGALSAAGRAGRHARIHALARPGVCVTASFGLTQQAGAEAAFRALPLGLDSAAVAFARFAAEGATVISF